MKLSEKVFSFLFIEFSFLKVMLIVSLIVLTKLKPSSFWSKLFHSCGSYTWYSKQRSATNRTAWKDKKHFSFPVCCERQFW